MIALVIAILHALPVIFAGLIWKSVAAVWIAAGLMIGVGALSGNPAYFFLDLLAVLAAGFYSHKQVIDSLGNSD